MLKFRDAEAFKISEKVNRECMFEDGRISKFFSEMFDKIIMPIAILDSKMQIIWLNKSMRRQFPHINIQKKPICYRSFYLPPKKSVCDYCPGIKALKTGKVHSSETGICADNRIYNVIACPVRDETGKIGYVIETAEDITQRKKAEDNLKLITLETKEERAKSEAIIAAIGDGISIQDVNFKILYQNRAHKQILGDQIGNYCYRAFVHRNNVCEGCPVALAFKDGKIHRAERNTTVGGKVMHFEITASLIRDVEGKIIAGIEVVRDITQRKKIEELLRGSEAKYRTLFNQAPDTIVLIDAETGTLIDFNDNACKNLGYTRKEFKTLKIPDFEAVESQGKVRRHIKNITKQGSDVFETKHRRKDGQVRDILVNAKAISFLEKDYIQSVWRDITEQKQAEERLYESEKKLRLAFESANDAILWADANTGLIVNCNKATEIILERKREEIIGSHQRSIHPPEKQKYYIKMFKKHVKQKGAINEIAEVITKSGKIKPVHISASLTLVNGISIIQGIFRDITEQVQASKKIEEQGQFLQKTIESLTHPFYVIDANDYTIKMANYSAHFGKLTSTSTCYSITHKSPKPCDETGGHPCTLKEVKRTKKPFTVEHIHYDSNGNARNMEVHGYPVFDSKGNVVQMIEYCLDVTARKQAENNLEAINKELIRSNRRLGKLALRDSHTGAYNHRYLEEAMGREFSRANRYAQPLSVIMLDIDYFKSINDVYGHQFGDLILQQFARQLKRMVRRYDIVIRFGGEEFVVICPGIDISAAFILTQRILNAINLYKFGNSQHSVKLKLSAAVSSYPENKIVKGLDLIDLADKILNKAKEDGGGRVYSYLDINKEKIEALKESDADREVALLKSKLNKLTKRSNQSLIESVFAFAKTIELKDYYTGKHVENTVAYAEGIARRSNLPKEEVELIKQAAALHDLGKIGISEKILLKRSRLTKSEYEEIKKHPQIAADIIRPIQFLHDIVPFILHHHERWDGTGYPSGLKEDDIPTGARILCVADAYQALISDRPYRKSYSKEEAIKMIKDGAGRQFDPQIVRTFVNILEQEN